MKKQYFIPIIGGFLIPTSTWNWWKNTPDKEHLYALFNFYHTAFAIATVMAILLICI